MVGHPKHLSDLRRIQASLRVTCRRCLHRREFTLAEAEALLAGRNQAWELLPGYFRCARCTVKQAELLPIPFGDR